MKYYKAVVVRYPELGNSAYDKLDTDTVWTLWDDDLQEGIATWFLLLFVLLIGIVAVAQTFSATTAYDAQSRKRFMVNCEQSGRLKEACEFLYARKGQVKK
jgi:hypothetical protein